MADKSNIGWTDATWNPVRGCERVSEGCRNCYAEVLAARHSYEGGWGYDIAEYVGGKPRWTGVIQTKDQQLKLPLKWKEPRMVFVNSMSDLFHDRVPFNFVDEIYEVMDRCPQHTFQILTKRPARMRDYLTSRKEKFAMAPIWNVWHGVSVEHQEAAEERIPMLQSTPSAVRWVSAEPLLSTVDLWKWTVPNGIRLDWVVVGGESGSGRRSMNMSDARQIIEVCRVAKVPVFVKQDNGPRPGMKGRFTSEEWALKQYPSSLPQRLMA